MRRSGANFGQKQPDPLTFFIDRNLGKHTIADILRKAGALVEVHDDHFPPNAPDHEWLPVVGEKGWVVLTKDKRIRYRGLELKALEDARVKAFVLVSCPARTNSRNSPPSLRAGSRRLADFP